MGEGEEAALSPWLLRTDGHRFDYRADPRRILLGNLIAVTLFFAYSVFGAVYPAVQLGTLGVGLLLLPWIVTRAYSFDAHNTVYRGLRFRFHGSLSAAAWTFLLRPLALIVSFGLYYPAWARARREYVVTNHRLGDAYFRFTAATRPYYAAYLAGGAIVLGSGLMAGIVVGVVSVWAGMGPVPPQWLAVMIPLLIYGAGFAALAAVSRWRFLPAMKHGVAVTSRMSVPIVFSIVDEPPEPPLRAEDFIPLRKRDPSSGAPNPAARP